MYLYIKFVMFYIILCEENIALKINSLNIWTHYIKKNIYKK